MNPRLQKIVEEVTAELTADPQRRKELTEQMKVHKEFSGLNRRAGTSDSDRVLTFSARAILCDVVDA